MLEVRILATRFDCDLVVVSDEAAARAGRPYFYNSELAGALWQSGSLGIGVVVQGRVHRSALWVDAAGEVETSSVLLLAAEV